MNPLGKDMSHITFITDVSNRRFGKIPYSDLHLLCLHVSTN